MEFDAKIFIASIDTFMGRALARRLRHHGYAYIRPESADEPFLQNRQSVVAYLERERPEYVFVCGGKSGGILANQRFPADLALDNLLIAANVIDAAARSGVHRLLFIAASCVYPKNAPQPMRVEYLQSGPLEPTSEAYATANLAGIALCHAYRQQYGMDFIAAVKADAFGVDDKFSAEDSHVVPSMLRRMHEAKLVGAPYFSVWGTGTPRREVMFADDVADAAIFVMNEYRGAGPINLGGGVDISIGALAEKIRQVVGYEGEIVFDTSKPDGAPLKVFNSEELLGMGWRPKTDLEEGLRLMYEAFLTREAGAGKAG